MQGKSLKNHLKRELEQTQMQIFAQIKKHPSDDFEYCSEASLAYPIANHPHALWMTKEMCKKETLWCSSERFIFNWWQTITLYTYFVNALMQVLPRDNETVKDIARKILRSISQQYSTIFLACDSYKAKNIKNIERIGRSSGLKYLLKVPDMIIPS